MMSASDAARMTIRQREEQIKSRIYDAIMRGLVSVIIPAELISDAVKVELISLGYALNPTNKTDNHDSGVSICWSEKI
jgi:hypothetical protein